MTGNLAAVTTWAGEGAMGRMRVPWVGRARRACCARARRLAGTGSDFSGLAGTERFPRWLAAVAPGRLDHQRVSIARIGRPLPLPLWHGHGHWQPVSWPDYRSDRPSPTTIARSAHIAVSPIERSFARMVYPLPLTVR